MKKEIHVAVCKGRHEIKEAVDGAIFPATIPNDVLIHPVELTVNAEITLSKLFKIDLITFLETDERPVVNLYITGLTVATLAIVNVCHEYDIQLVCWHYDRETGTYFPQDMM